MLLLSKRKLYKIIYIIPVTFMLSMDAFLYGGSVSISISEMLVLRIFEKVRVDDMQVFVLIIDKIVYLILFHLLYGNLISEEFRHNSVYVFSRLKNRRKWFFCRALHLVFIAFFYTLIFIGLNLLISMALSRQNIAMTDIRLIMVIFIIIWMTIVFTTLVINLLSIRFGNSLGFIVTYAAIVIFIFLSSKGQTLFSGNASALLLLNPMSGINVDILYQPKQQVIFIAYYLFLIVSTIVFGMKYIDYLDLTLRDAENQ